MRVLIIDFQGTLTRVANPVGFVKVLQEQGDFVALFSGSLAMDIERKVPGLLDTVNCFVEKPANPRDIVDGVAATEVIVVDDEAMIGKALVRFGRGRPEPWRFLPAEDIEQLRTGMT